MPIAICLYALIFNLAPNHFSLCFCIIFRICSDVYCLLRCIVLKFGSSASSPAVLFPATSVLSCIPSSVLSSVPSSIPSSLPSSVLSSVPSPISVLSSVLSPTSVPSSILSSVPSLASFSTASDQINGLNWSAFSTTDCIACQNGNTNHKYLNNNSPTSFGKYRWIIFIFLVCR